MHEAYPADLIMPDRVGAENAGLVGRVLGAADNFICGNKLQKAHSLIQHPESKALNQIVSANYLTEYTLKAMKGILHDFDILPWPFQKMRS
ncbi:hypothetical protein [Dyadobacter sandarakinus]|uniref:Uncharacterized protein n=1 Tax=Dyadobacter sandarakinus TaxID=2747268 RepID=A0ABX7I6A5_9BACT|nr:hypothetical protein [Dyadobacter sandarakinus]QRR01409.1 hypothetical protein HWI92_11090 [Dyadobacter sandarakinus]